MHRPKVEATPIVVDGVMYLTRPPSDVIALDAETGRALWTFEYRVAAGVYTCCGQVNRGLAILGSTLFITTLDVKLLALDARSGRVLWKKELGDPGLNYTATGAPLAIKDKVIAGIAGAEGGIRGFLDAYDAKTGERVWRFYTVPAPGEPGSETWENDAWKHGGGSTWTTGSYDPELNLVFWGTGNAGPDYNGEAREGDNLYTASIVALDGDTGKIRWHYQFTPHDVWDWDSTQVPVLADVTIGGQPRKVVIFANRNGFFYVLERATGKLIYGKPFIQTSWAKELTPEGRPILLPGSLPSEQGTKVCPDASGGTNWMSPSFDPSLGLMFVTSRDACGTFFNWKDEYRPGEGFRGGAVSRLDEFHHAGLRAIDV